MWDWKGGTCAGPDRDGGPRDPGPACCRMPAQHKARRARMLPGRPRPPYAPPPPLRPSAPPPEINGKAPFFSFTVVTSRDFSNPLHMLHRPDQRPNYKSPHSCFRGF